ncbi:unnamed protein product [Strongylus vulgaris]|uniref:Uncharacterized protein n=1 Tax=Strongylus vulgaris TaxID=40348 RepID=A0A3P7IY60_STRVU|nr:unnamed protein product [Strongylus vulgaris]
MNGCGQTLKKNTGVQTEYTNTHLLAAMPLISAVLYWDIVLLWCEPERGEQLAFATLDYVDVCSIDDPVTRNLTVFWTFAFPDSLLSSFLSDF